MKETKISDALSLLSWRKSTHSGADNGDCVEVADGIPGIMPVRDSKAPAGPALMFRASGWSSFISAVRGDELPTG